MLLGTCLTLASQATEAEINDPVFCAELDEEATCCPCCDWWTDPANMDNDECEDCRSHG